jgi:alpha-amylase/alpha-mannosidase (GH57 family)
MNRYVCIHGHFYQPPRENPWLEDVELQDSAYPYHDWNERITEECYRQNAASRILGPDRKIIDIVNNYSKISFDFGPTLLIWLQSHEPEVYEKIIEADKKGMEHFSGYGPALAQPYNHMIMPLANNRDKHTQVIWGIGDFQQRFGREPEGMWLPETAVNIETLEVLAEYGIKFTILAPHQAKRVRRKGEEGWEDLKENAIDSRKAYLCRLPSGAEINLFFYQGPVSKKVAYGSLLHSGDILAKDILEVLDDEPEQPQLAHIATDGETYGHHHRRGDMALAYCLHHIESNNLSQITVYGQFLEKNPPEYEVEINENTSWSCPHGIERWKSNCNCSYDQKFAGKQQWRAPLREALDWLREQLITVFEDKISQFLSEPWEARNKYISVINNRESGNIEKFLSGLINREIVYEDKVKILKLLEMQRNAMLMYTSCGWFFDDISGIETVQIMQYASRAIQLAKEISGNDFEVKFESMLEKAPSNYVQFNNGKDIYDKLVKPGNIDLNRVGAHIAISSLFDENPDETQIYCYSTKIEQYDRYEAGIQKLAMGRVVIQSKVLLEKNDIDFIVLYLGGHNLTGAVSGRMPDDEFINVKKSISEAFKKGDVTEVMRLMNISFEGNNYSLWHLFKDQQRKILYELLNATWEEIEASFRHIYEYNYTIMQVMRSMNIPLPKALSTPAEFVLNEDLCREIANEGLNTNRLKALTETVKQLSLQIDEPKVRFESNHKINYLMGKLESSPENVEILQKIKQTVEILMSVLPELDLEEAQNIFFAINKRLYPEMNKRANSGDQSAQEWLIHFNGLADSLHIVIS